MSGSTQQFLPIIGWREWLSLPELQADHIKAKIDTGARSSALHAFDIHIEEHPVARQMVSPSEHPPEVQSGVSSAFGASEETGEAIKMVHFKIHPHQRNNRDTIEAQAPLHDIRTIRSSNGHTQTRPVIQTTIQLGDYQWPIELTLTNRDVMGFRMLLGRQAVRQRFLIDSGHSYLQSGKLRKSRL